GTGWGTRPARAEKPAAGATDAPKAADKDKPETGPTLAGAVKSVDEARHTLTVTVLAAPGKKETAERTFDLPRDVKVLLEPGLATQKGAKREEKEGRLADVSPGTPVDLDLSADQKSVRAVHVHGRSLRGTVKAVDPARNGLTLTVKGEGGPQEKTVTLLDGARVLLDDGLVKGGAKEGKLADLGEGIAVLVNLSAGEKDRAVSVSASGRSL